MKISARNFPTLTLISFAVAALCICLIAFFSDRRLPHPSTFAYLAIWVLLGTWLAWLLLRLPSASRKLWIAARNGLLAFIAIAGATTMSTLDHDNHMPNAAAYATELIVSVLLGGYLAFPEKIEALLTERK